MKDTLVVDVTTDDIRHGQKCRLRSCPIALTMTRAIQQRYNVKPKDFYVEVAETFISIVPHGLSEKVGASVASEDVWLPDEAVCFIANYDEERPSEPFKFELEIELQQLGFQLPNPTGEN